MARAAVFALSGLLLLLASACSAAPVALGVRGPQVAYVSLQGDGRVAIFDIDRVSGEWAFREDVRLGTDVSGWATSAPIAIAPDRRSLHVGLRGSGSVATYAIGQDGGLSFVDTASIGGSAPFLARDPSGRWLLASYYFDGKVSVFRVDERGAVVAGPVQETVTASNAHSVLLDPTSRFLLVPHTGPNVIHQFQFDAAAGTFRPNDPATVQPPPGRGPRHSRFHPTLPVVYIINEAGSSVTAYRFDRENGTLAEWQDISTLPADFQGSSTTADLHLTRDGRFLYGSNRGHDSIAAYAVDDSGGLKLVGIFETEQTPRSFAIDPTGRFLYAAGQGSGVVAAYSIDQTTGALTRFASYEVGPVPTWIEIVEL